MFLLTAKFVKTDWNLTDWTGTELIKAGTYFIFLKNKYQLKMLLIPNFELRENISKALIKSGKFFAFFCHLVALTLFFAGRPALGYHSMKFQHFPNIS